MAIILYIPSRRFIRYGYHKMKNAIWLFLYLVLNADRGRNDRLGALYRAHMQQSSVVFNEKPVQGMTGTCVVLISDGAQRTMLTCLGVSSEIDYEDIDEELLKHSSYIYLEGYLFESERTVQTMLQAVAVARRNGVKIALTASDAFCIARHRDLLVQLIQNDVDLLFANAREARALTQPIPDTPRNRRYFALINRELDETYLGIDTKWLLESGGSGYRARQQTNTIGRLAFCYRTRGLRYYQNPKILEKLRLALLRVARHVTADGKFVWPGDTDMYWAGSHEHAWRLEPVLLG